MADIMRKMEKNTKELMNKRYFNLLTEMYELIKKNEIVYISELSDKHLTYGLRQKTLIDKGVIKKTGGYKYEWKGGKPSMYMANKLREIGEALDNAQTVEPETIVEVEKGQISGLDIIKNLPKGATIDFGNSIIVTI